MVDHEPEIICDFADGVLTLSINRPAFRNSLTVRAAKSLYSRLVEAKGNPALKVLILRGRGADFSCGADIHAAVVDDRPESAPSAEDPEPYRVAQLLYEFPAVTVAAIKGGCAGAAIERWHAAQR